MIDLHTHSSASDGDFSPELLIQEAAKKGISAIALTDHDTLSGLKTAEKEAKAVGIRFIPGIEISINWPGCTSRTAPTARAADTPGLGPGGEFHLLGLGIQSPSPAFLAAIDALSRRREARNREMLNRMNELGFEAAWEDIPALADSHSIGRPHFANLLVKKKIVKNSEQAFAHYLKPGKPLFVPKTGLDFVEAVTLIRESGGISVLAHPMSLYVAWGRLPELIKALKTRGLMGIEAWHPTAKTNSCRRLEKLGKELALYVTEGSDFHGSFRPYRQLGYSSRDRKINNAILEALPI
ncbi:MAG: PHP domain-containing protein [Treponema sp.]|nr:PHP domain-containing protein [Treponema sp.]